MKLTQKNFDKLIDSLNHKMTQIEGDIKWIKRIVYYMAGISTAAVGGIIKVMSTG